MAPLQAVEEAAARKRKKEEKQRDNAATSTSTVPNKVQGAESDAAPKAKRLGKVALKVRVFNLSQKTMLVN